MDHNTSKTLLAQNKILTQQLEALTAQMTKLPQQLQVVQVSQSQSQPIRCDLCGGDQSNGHCAYQNNSSKETILYMGNQGRQGERSNQNQSLKQDPFQQQQPLYPSSQEKISKLEDTLEKFMQTTLSNQKNFDIVVKNLQTQLRQIEQQLKKFREQCKTITMRSEIVVGKGIGDNFIVEKEIKNEEKEMKSENERKSKEKEIESEEEKEKNESEEEKEKEKEKNESVHEEKKKRKKEKKKKKIIEKRVLHF